MSSAGRLELLCILYENGHLCNCPAVTPVPDAPAMINHNDTCDGINKMRTLLGFEELPRE